MARKKKTAEKKAKKVVKKVQRERKAVEKADKLAEATTEEIVKSSVDKILDKIRQNLAGRLNDEARPLLAEFSTGLQKRLLEHCQVWAGTHTDGNIPILPDNTKYYTKSGDAAVVVLEFKPQVRTLIMAKGLMDHCPDRGTMSEADKKGIGVAVALPYIILILPFSHNKSQGIYLNCRNQPLSHLGDMLYFSNLPNVNNGDNKVCMGQMFADSEVSSMASRPITEQVDKLANAFWLSTFNSDYTGYYSTIAKGNDSMRNLRAWHETSLRDPLFVLKINWQKDKTLREQIHRFVGDSTGRTGLSNTFQREMEKTLTLIIERLQTFFNGIKGVISVKDDRVLTTVVNERIKEVINRALEQLEAEKKLVEQERRVLEGNAGWDDYGYGDKYGNNPWKRSW